MLKDQNTVIAVNNHVTVDKEVRLRLGARFCFVGGVFALEKAHDALRMPTIRTYKNSYMTDLYDQLTALSFLAVLERALVRGVRLLSIVFDVSYIFFDQPDGSTGLSDRCR